MIRTLLVDDEKLVRSGFKLMLSTEDGIEIIGEADDGEQAIALARRENPDVILMDVHMPGIDGIEATRQITAETDCKVIILTTFDTDEHLFNALGAGASGFLLKNTAPEDLLNAIVAIGNGQALLAPEVTLRVIQKCVVQDRGDVDATGAASGPERPLPTALNQLTSREYESLLMLARGLTNAEIAAEWVVSEATVKTHVSNMFSKLHLRDRVQAVIFAYEHGLTRGDEGRDGHAPPPTG